MPSARTSIPADASAAIPPLGRVQEDKGAALWITIENAVARLEEAVEQETAALQGRAGADLREFHDRKSQGLLELTRAMRHVHGALPSPRLTSRLVSLRARLEANSAVLKLHLDAVREVSATMADAMRSVESDGTYSHRVPHGNGKAP